MKENKVVIVLLLVTLIVLLSCKGEGKAAEAADNALQIASNLEKRKNNNNTQKPENTKSECESSNTNLCEEDVTNVSIIQLIANPEQFHGKVVRLVGFVSLEFEGDAIYLHEHDYKYGLTRNGLWLNLTKDCCGKDIRMFDKKYVLVEGTFNAKNRGHMSLLSGAIEDIKRFQVWVVKKRGKGIGNK